MDTDTRTAPGLIYQKIPAIMREVGAVGKNKKNQGQGYNFRGIDDMYNALHEHLSNAGVFATPRVIKREREERTTGKGGLLIYTILDVEHIFYAEDGSNISVITTGEAMDSGDKSSNKAMSAAFKYALMELFCIPTEEKLDTEYSNPEPAPRKRAPEPQQQAPQRPQPQPPAPRAQAPQPQQRPSQRRDSGVYDPGPDGIQEQRRPHLEAVPAADAPPRNLSPMQQVQEHFVQCGYPGESHPNHILAALHGEGFEGKLIKAGDVENCKALLDQHYAQEAPRTA